MNCNELQKYIQEKFPIVYSISFLCPTFLMGGALRDFELGNEPKDLDFVCLDSDNIIEAALTKFNLEYRINNLGGYKVRYKDMDIDIWTTDDLFSAVEYNIDGLFYDVKNNYLIPFGHNIAIKNGLKKLNYDNNIQNKKRQKQRKEKLLKYISAIKNN